MNELASQDIRISTRSFPDVFEGDGNAEDGIFALRAVAGQSERSSSSRMSRMPRAGDHKDAPGLTLRSARLYVWRHPEEQASAHARTIMPPSPTPPWQAAFDEPTNSQIAQESWVLAMCEGRRGGRFAEIGAFDGILHSNTYMLESRHGWGGVLVEPNPILFAKLAASRRATCLERAVHREGGQFLSFVASQEIGTLAEYAEADGYAEHRRQTISENGLITVETVTFDRMARADGHGDDGFDYVSLDTEGSELDILRTIDLARHRIALFTIEHNFIEPRRETMRVLLSEAGYARLNVGFDDWYWHADHLRARNGGTLPDIAAINAHVKSIYQD